jgi:hypothetical protein
MQRKQRARVRAMEAGAAAHRKPQNCDESKIAWTELGQP